MIRFKCPGCFHLHAANPSFGGMTAKCIHCGVLMRVPSARPQSAARPQPAGRAPVSSDDEQEPEDSDFLLDPGETSSREDEEEVAEDDVPDAEIEESRDEENEDDEAKEAPQRKSGNWLVWIVAAVAVAALAGGGYLLFGKQGTKTPPTTPSTPPTTPTVESDDPPAPEPPPAAPPAAPPPSPPPEDPPALNAARLVHEYLQDGVETNRRYAGKPIVLRGMFGFVRYQSFQLLDGGELVSIDCRMPDGPNPHPPAALGGAGATYAILPAMPDYSRIREGTPVTIRGIYQADCKLTECIVLKTAAPADEKHAGRSVVVSGTVALLSLAPENGPFPIVTLEPPSTDVRTQLQCLFKPSERADLSKIQLGQRVNIRGTCSTRLMHTVRIENCQLVPSDVPAMPAEHLFADFETDLLPGDPVSVTAAPIALSAAELGGAWAADSKATTSKYFRKRLLVTGVLIDRNAYEKTVTFESATDQVFTVKLHMTPTRFAQLPETDESRTPYTFLCIFSGQSTRKVLRLDGGVWVQPPEDRTSLRVSADYFPELSPVWVLTYDRVQYGGPGGNAMQRFTVRFTETKQIRLTPQLIGTYPGRSLFQEQPVKPKWTRDLRKSKGGPTEQTIMYRVEGKSIEIGQSVAGSVTGAQAGTRWEAVLQIGAKRGQSWIVEVPSGPRIVYTVTGFPTDAHYGAVVEVLRVAYPNPSNSGPIEESLITYAKGVGEVTRVVSAHFPNGTGRVTGETKLVDEVAPVPRAPDKK